MTDPRQRKTVAHGPDQPLVSVIMATYNCADTLDEAVESILAQTYRNWELIICDDASTDATYGRLQQLVDDYPDRITLLRNERNSKLSFSLNRCLDLARGEFIARMDADDRSDPRRLEILSEHLVRHPEHDVVGSAIQRFDSRGLRDVVRLEPEPSRQSMRRGVPFVHASIMMRSTAYAALGGYTVAKRTQRGQDLDLWFRFMASGRRGANLPSPLYLVREDLSAVKRRSFIVRWRSLQTTLLGYRLLGAPTWWYVRAVLELSKALVPAPLFMAYRGVQTRRGARKQPRAVADR